jgi:palmitoyltransferase
VFGRRETGAAVLGGQAVNYTEMYVSPARMDGLGGGGRRRGGYEAVAGEEV